MFAHPIYYLRPFSFTFSHPRRNLDPGSHSGPFSPLPTTVRTFTSISRRTQHFPPSSTRVELCNNFRNILFRTQADSSRHNKHARTSELPPTLHPPPQLPKKLRIPRDTQPARSTKLCVGARCRIYKPHKQTGEPSHAEGTTYYRGSNLTTDKSGNTRRISARLSRARKQALCWNGIPRCTSRSSKPFHVTQSVAEKKTTANHHLQRLHDSAMPVVVRLERQELLAAMPRVVDHPTTIVQEFPETGGSRHNGMETDLELRLS